MNRGIKLLHGQHHQLLFRNGSHSLLCWCLPNTFVKLSIAYYIILQEEDFWSKNTKASPLYVLYGTIIVSLNGQLIENTDCNSFHGEAAEEMKPVITISQMSTVLQTTIQNVISWGPNDSMSALVQIMASRRTGDNHYTDWSYFCDELSVKRETNPATNYLLSISQDIQQYCPEPLHHTSRRYPRRNWCSNALRTNRIFIIKGLWTVTELYTKAASNSRNIQGFLLANRIG